MLPQFFLHMGQLYLLWSMLHVHRARALLHNHSCSSVQPLASNEHTHARSVLPTSAPQCANVYALSAESTSLPSTSKIYLHPLYK